MSKVIPDAISNYKELINCDAYYVDKTPHIKTILESTSKKTRKVQCKRALLPPKPKNELISCNF